MCNGGKLHKPFRISGIFNPLTHELPEHGVRRPGAPRHNIIFNSFFRNFQADISSSREYTKDLEAGNSALRKFVTVTVGETGFSALRGERGLKFVK